MPVEQAAVRREPHSWVLACQACGAKRVLELGMTPAMKDRQRGPMAPHPFFTAKTYQQWFALDHRGCT